MSELTINADVDAAEQQPAASSGTPVKASPATPVRTWAWGCTREPYDWMDGHTPSGALDSWRS